MLRNFLFLVCVIMFLFGFVGLSFFTRSVRYDELKVKEKIFLYVTVVGFLLLISIATTEIYKFFF